MKEKKNLDYGDLVESLGAVAVRPHGKTWPTHTNRTRARNQSQSHNVLSPKVQGQSASFWSLCFWPSGSFGSN
jgi:hypothetical protein